MPHSTTEQIVNGDSNSSKTISHLTSYPAVSEGIETFKSNPYGKKSLEIVDNAYARFGKPVEPYLETPYSYAKPYVSKADELGDKTLDTIEGHFPIVKDNTKTIVEKAKGTAFWPYHYLTETWNDEYTKTANHNRRGAGITTSVLAIVSLELRIASDFFHYVADNLRPVYEDSKDKLDELTKSAQDKAGEVKKDASKKADEAHDTAHKKGQEVKDTANKKTDEAKDTAQKTKEKAQK
ncbi:hypothetical protein MRB53_037981 [Persea americana]|nr:hypothetical protein MRB53_037981 [Persea americana]